MGVPLSFIIDAFTLTYRNLPFNVKGCVRSAKIAIVRRTRYINDKFKGECKCGTPHLTEETIKEKFLEAYSQLLPDRERLIEDCRLMQTELTDCSDIDREKQNLLQELEIVMELIRRCVDENS